jgi:hypothetical protein
MGTGADLGTVPPVWRVLLCVVPAGRSARVYQLQSSEGNFSKTQSSLKNRDIMVRAEEIIAVRDFKLRTEFTNELIKKVIRNSS